jgi:nucleoside transporter
MDNTMKVKLSLMMFLQFFIWSAWFVTMGTYLGDNLGADGSQIGKAFETQSLGAIIAPFIIGLIADRFFSAQKILGVLHMAGAVFMYLAATSMTFAEFYPYILLYMLMYMPTLALVNAVAFRQMTDPAKDFAPIRLWGTVGWIAAGLLIGFVFLWEAKELLQNTFYLAAGASAILGLFSFTLPDTPPESKGEKASLSQILGLDALGLLKDRNYLVFFISSVLICIPLAFYYQNANVFLNQVGMDNAAGVMTLGQVSEVLFMLVIPVFLKRFGMKYTLLFGMLAWVLRYLLFAYGDAGSSTWMLIMGIVLHGICYDFFFVSGQIYTDYKAGEKIRSAAQGLITLATYGVGMLIGFRLAGYIYDANFIADKQYDWQSIWTTPAMIAGAVALLFVLAFKNERVTTDV